MSNIIGKRGYGISPQGEKIIGEIIEVCQKWVTIYPDGETGSIDETAWVFEKNKITLV